MKIIFCVNKDLYATHCLKLLLTYLQSHQVFLLYTDSLSTPPEHMRELITFERHILTQQTSITDIYHHDIWETSLLLPKKNRQEQINDFFTEINPDLVISIRFSYIFKQPELSISKYGVINLHSGILPYYRGIMASFHALYDNQDNLGTTLHFIDDKNIDTGRIIQISKQKSKKSQSYLFQVLRLYEQGAKDIAHYTKKILQKENIYTTTQEDGTYFRYPNKEKVYEFLTTGQLLYQESDINETLNLFRKS